MLALSFIIQINDMYIICILYVYYNYKRSNIDIVRDRIFYRRTDILRTVLLTMSQNHCTRSDAVVNVNFALGTIAILSDRVTSHSVTFLVRYSCTCTRMTDVQGRGEQGFPHLVQLGTLVITATDPRNNKYCLRDNYRYIEEMLFSLLFFQQ